MKHFSQSRVPAYSDQDSAALYDRLYPWGPCDDFYLALVMNAPSVLDVGCGTGTLLRRAREFGHPGRLCGIDPDAARLDRARRRADVEWQRSTAASMTWDREFHLAIMTGSEAGFSIETQYGGWHGEAFIPTSPEIITIAQRVD